MEIGKCKDRDKCISYKCEFCIRNKDAKLKDQFKSKEYEPTCAYGYTDCICDPAYKLYCYEKGYHDYKYEEIEELVQEVKQGCYCGYGAPWYDNEDK